MELKLRKVGPSDRDAYLRLARAFYRSGAALFIANDEKLNSTFDELVRSDVYAEAFIFEADGVDAGFVLLAKTYSQEAGGMVLWLEELYVEPDYRSLGIGSRVFDFLQNRYGKQFARMRLEIEEENADAKRLYERHGFTDYPYRQMKREL